MSLDASGAEEPISAIFTCAICGKPASTVTLLGPDDREPTDRPAADAMMGTPRLLVDGPFGVTHGLIAQFERRVGPVAAALRAADPEALMAIDPEYTPFWCPTCRAAYCREHLQTWIVFDAEMPGWYDHTMGRCPAGHERMIDD